MTDKMKEAIELLKKEEFYLRKTDRRSVWLSYNLGKPIHTKTMKALEERGVVKIELSLVNNADMVAKLIDPDYEELTASEYCLRCTDSYESDYYGAAEPPVRCGVSHLSGLTEPPF